MAIQTEFIDFIVNISAIRTKYPGGWEACRRDIEHLIGGRIWHDDYLLRDGTVSKSGIAAMVDYWTRKGLTGRARVENEECWVDFCIYESLLGGTTLPCAWLIPHGPSSVKHVDDRGSSVVGREPALFNQ